MDYTGYGGYHASNLEARTASASPVQLVIVLMTGLLDEMARARAHIVAQRYEEKGVSINKCIDMLNGLSSALDFESGAPVVVNLAQLYDYCSWRLNQAGVTLDPALVDEVTDLVTTLFEAWQGVEQRNG
ncbi:flagellar export chaperone FliS [Paraburkholderia bonniea]|uniref:flagellar export chaperone FliS n=1 Tax=Paraburkholderia bonniea TaxID=2152891 RepID=UPI001291EED8|nr:flagellar export chaperone FliS [Paraburkholderia bonniea]WJF90778.1 flagellar export chaperone FliS [Paraburkholderia bonniea]WJF94092.1 flagellar export chaperone FliS [Paraburkholderia bonniea]